MTVDISHAVHSLLEARRSGATSRAALRLARPRCGLCHPGRRGAHATGPVARLEGRARARPPPSPIRRRCSAGALVKSPARFDGEAMHMIGVEIEISFHIAHDIAARDKAVGPRRGARRGGRRLRRHGGGRHAAGTISKVSMPEWLLADNQMNHALVMGDRVKDWSGLDWPDLQVMLVDRRQHDRRPARRAGRRRPGASARLDDRPRGAPPRRHPQRPGDHHRLVDRPALLPAGHARARRVRGTGRRSKPRSEARLATKRREPRQSNRGPRRW